MIEALGTGPAVVALEGGTVLGFMIAPLPSRPGPARSWLGDAHHAAIPAGARAAYRRMYEVIAGELVAAGCFEHSVPVLGSASTTREALHELGFGVDQVKGALDLRSFQPSPPTPESVRATTADDLPQLVELAIELQKFHSRAPMLQPALLDVAATRKSLLRDIGDEGTAVFVAQNEGVAIGMIGAEPDPYYRASARVGYNVVTASAAIARSRHGDARPGVQMGTQPGVPVLHRQLDLGQPAQRPLLPRP